MVRYTVEKCPQEYDEYKFTLNKKFLKMAQENLQETAESRAQSLAQMRDWIAKHPHIKKCRTDSVFLLRFLRMHKFSVPRAQETLERYLAMRQTFPQWFQNLDPLNSTTKVLNDAGLNFHLGQDSAGRTVILVRKKIVDINGFDFALDIRQSIMMLETTFDDEEAQIGGYTIIIDYSDLGLKQLSVYTPLNIKHLADCINHSLPIRLQQVHFLNLPKMFEFIIHLMHSCLAEKLRNRLYCHKSMEDAAKHLEVSMLTTEYPGGTQDPEELKRNFIKRAQDKRQELLLLDEMEIDASRYKSLWHQTTDGSIESGVAGSFKKLNVD
uniref:CRAL-TRIO domain-containing protein n=1 Tax=Culex tarsalis TaxID=7177 RepID=A0A1Q3FSR0_CULTA